MTLVRPGWVDRALKNQRELTTYEEELDLQVHLLHGPFNWAVPKTAANRSNCAKATDWQALVKAVGSSAHEIDITAIGKVVPLPTTR